MGCLQDQQWLKPIPLYFRLLGLQNIPEGDHL